MMKKIALILAGASLMCLSLIMIGFETKDDQKQVVYQSGDINGI